MADADDLELDSESNTGSAQAAAVRKNIPLKLKGKARGRGRRSTRARKVPTKKSAPHPTTAGFGDDETEESTESSNKKFDIGEDISKLEAPTFTTLERGLPEPVHQNKKLRWDHRVHLIGEKVMNPMIHCCGKCGLPILMYGRMIPCKHVFCFECARKAEKICPKCKEVIHRVEPSKLGTVFMCTFGGPRHGTGGCRRTYLSQRDLQAHINHRHMRTTVTHASTATTHAQLSHPTQATSNISANTTVQKTPHLASGRDPRDPRTHLVVETVHASHTPPQSTHPIPPASSHASHLHPHLPPEHREPADSTRPTSSLGSPVASSRSSHPYQHTSTTTAHMHGSYPSTIPSVSTRPNLITVPIQDDSTTSNQHVHVQSHQSQYSPAAASQTHQLPPMQHQNANNAYSSHHYQPHPSPTSSYSPVPPVTYGTSLSTQSFNPAPPTHMPPPPMHNANTAMYPNPPPSVHHPQQSSYSAPPLGGVSHSLPPQPQRFSSSSSYDENYSSQGWSSGVPPPSRNPHSTRAMQGPQNSSNVGILQQCGQEPGFRSSYYQ